MRKGAGAKNETGTGAGADLGTGTGTDIIKKKRGRPKGSKSGYTQSELTRNRNMKNGKAVLISQEDRDYNARLIAHSLQCYELSQHCNVNDVESLRASFLQYVKLCAENGFNIGNIGACTAMGISYDVLTKWARGDRRASNPAYRELAMFISSVCAMSREQMINDSKLNPVIGIFWQRNYDGLRNDTEQQQVLTDNDSMDKKTIDDYRKKYGDLLDE